MGNNSGLPPDMRAMPRKLSGTKRVAMTRMPRPVALSFHRW